MKKSNHKKNNKKEKEEPVFPADDYKPVDETNTDKFEVDDDEILSEVEKLAKNHRKQKLHSVFELIGKPSKYTALLAGSGCNDELLTELVLLLENKGIMIHFKNEYPVAEKCRFIIEEIFNQGVDSVKNGNHINFIYEDFHPEKILDDEEPEIEDEF